MDIECTITSTGNRLLEIPGMGLEWEICNVHLHLMQNAHDSLSQLSVLFMTLLML